MANKITILGFVLILIVSLPSVLAIDSYSIFFEGFESGWGSTVTGENCFGANDCVNIGGFSSCDSNSGDFFFCATSDADAVHTGSFGLLVEDWDGGSVTSELGIWYNFDPSTACGGSECDYITLDMWMGEEGLDNGEFGWVTEQNQSDTPISMVSVTNGDGKTLINLVENFTGDLASNSWNARIMALMGGAAEEVFIDDINITGYKEAVEEGSFLCYQETANVSTACGGLDTGAYATNEIGLDNPAVRCYDGSFSTFCQPDGIPDDTGEFYVNYTKPINALSSSFLRNHLIAEQNDSIPSGCWSQDPLQFAVFMDVGEQVFNLTCNDGLGWEEMRIEDDGFIEEGMYWNMTGQDPSKVSACANLTVANSVYNVQNDLTADGTCIYIKANNITLEGNGFNIDFSIADNGITLTSGVNVYGVNDSLVRNLTINSSDVDGDLTLGVWSDSTAAELYNDIWEDLTINGTTIGFDIEGINTTVRNSVLDSITQNDFVVAEGGDNVTFENITSLGDAQTEKFQFDASTNVLIVNYNAEGNNLVYLNAGGESNTNVTIIDSVLNGAITINSPDDFTMINTTYSPEVVDGGSLSRYWYVDVQTNNTVGALSGVNVNITNTSQSQLFYGITDAGGFISTQTLKIYTNDSGTTILHTPFNITGNKTGYATNSTSSSPTDNIFITLFLQVEGDSFSSNVTSLFNIESFVNNVINFKRNPLSSWTIQSAVDRLASYIKLISQVMKLDGVPNRVASFKVEVTELFSIDSLADRLYSGFRSISLLISLGDYDTPQNGLIGWWTFDDNSTTVFDKSGYGLDGTYSGESNFTNFSKLGAGSGDFFGTRYYNTTDNEGDFGFVDYGAYEPYEFTYQDNFSFSWWMYRTSETSSQNGMVVFGIGVYSDSVGCVISSNEAIVCGARNVTNDIIEPGSASGIINLNQWQHGVYTFESGNLSVYLDGVIVASQTDVDNNFDLTGMQFELSRQSFGGNFQSWNGSIDEFRIYNRTLSIDEITQIFQSTSNQRQFSVGRTLGLNRGISEEININGFENILSDLRRNVLGEFNIESFVDIYKARQVKIIELFNAQSLVERLFEGVRESVSQINLSGIIDIEAVMSYIREVVLSINVGSIVDGITSLFRSIFGIFNLSEVMDKYISINILTSEAFNIDSEAGTTLSLVRQIFGSMNLDTIANRISFVFKSILVQFNIGDGVSNNFLFDRSVEGIFNIDSATSRIYGSVRTSISLFDIGSSVDRLAILNKQISSSISVLPSLDRIVFLVRQLISEITILSLVQETFTDVGNVFTRGVSGDINIASSIENRFHRVRDLFSFIEIDGVTVTESILEYLRTITQQIKVLDSINNLQSLIRGLLGLFRLESSVDEVYFANRDSIEIFNINSISDRTLEAVREIIISMNLESSVDRLMQLYLEIIESFNIFSSSQGDYIDIGTTFDRVSSEEINIDSSIENSFNRVRELFSFIEIDGITITESSLRYLRTLTQQIKILNFVDDLQSLIRGMLSLFRLESFVEEDYLATRISSEEINIDSSIENSFNRVRTNLISIDISSFANKYFGGIREIFQEINLSDLLDKIAGIFREPSAEINIDSSIKNKRGLVVEIGQSFEIESAVERLVSLVRELNDRIIISADTSLPGIFSLVENIQDSFSVDSVVERTASFYRDIIQGIGLNAIKQEPPVPLPPTSGSGIIYLPNVVPYVQLNQTIIFQ